MATTNDLPVTIQTIKITNGPKKTIYYPRVTGMANTRFEARINQTITHQVSQLIHQQLDNQPTENIEMDGSYEIKTNERGVLSLSLSNYSYAYHAAHGMTYLKSLTFNLHNEELCYLKDLFTPSSGYVDILSAIIQSQITKRDIPLLDGFTSIWPDQDFYIADKALVIYFQLYDITPYYVGFPMFPISVFELQDILAEKGPLERMAVNN